MLKKLKNLNKFDSEQIILVKTGDSGPSSSPVNSISRGGFVNSDPSKNSKPSNSDCKVPFRAAPGGSGNPGDGGGVSWDDDVLEENKVPEQSKWKDDWRRYNPSFSQAKEKPEQCLNENVYSEIKQNRGGNYQLPDIPNYKYNLKTKTARKVLKTTWENKIARKSILSALESMDKGELLPRNQKNFESYKELKEIKVQSIRMLVKPVKKGAEDEIVAIFLKKDMAKVEKNLKNVNSDNIDFGVVNEMGYIYIVTVGTPQDLLEEMKQEKTNFIKPYSPMIILDLKGY